MELTAEHHVCRKLCITFAWDTSVEGRWHWQSKRMRPAICHVCEAVWNLRETWNVIVFVIHLVIICQTAHIFVRVRHLKDLVHHSFYRRQLLCDMGGRGSRCPHGGHPPLGVTFEVCPFLNDFDNFSMTLTDLIDTCRHIRPCAVFQILRNAPVELSC